MDTHVPLRDGVFWVRVNDRCTELFESLWPLPYGVSHNSYLIDDETVVLIDTVKKFFFDDDYLEQIRADDGDQIEQCAELGRRVARAVRPEQE